MKINSDHFPLHAANIVKLLADGWRVESIEEHGDRIVYRGRALTERSMAFVATHDYMTLGLDLTISEGEAA